MLNVSRSDEWIFDANTIDLSPVLEVLAVKPLALAFQRRRDYE